jgi:hypothetical protein
MVPRSPATNNRLPTNPIIGSAPAPAPAIPVYQYPGNIFTNNDKPTLDINGNWVFTLPSGTADWKPTGWCSGVQTYSPDGGATIYNIPYTIPQLAYVFDAKKNSRIIFDFTTASIPASKLTLSDGETLDKYSLQQIGQDGKSHFYGNISESVFFNIGTSLNPGYFHKIQYPKIPRDPSGVFYFNAAYWNLYSEAVNPLSFPRSKSTFDSFYFNTLANPSCIAVTGVTYTSQSNPLYQQFFTNGQSDIIFRGSSPYTIPLDFVREIFWGGTQNYPGNGDLLNFGEQMTSLTNTFINILGQDIQLYPNYQINGGIIGNKPSSSPVFTRPVGTPNFTLGSFKLGGNTDNFAIRFNTGFWATGKVSFPVKATITIEAQESLHYAPFVDQYVFYIDKNQQTWNSYNSIITGTFVNGINVDKDIQATTIVNTIDACLNPVQLTGTSVYIKSHTFSGASISPDGKTLVFSQKNIPKKFPLLGNVTIDYANYANYSPGAQVVSVTIWNPQTQVITFPNPVGGNSTTLNVNQYYPLSGTASSNLPVYYTTSNSGVAIITGISGKSYLYSSKPGNFIVNCYQDGNATGYLAAPISNSPPNQTSYRYFSSLKSQRISWTYTHQSNGVATPPGLPVQPIPLVAVSFDYVSGMPLQNSNGLPISFTSSNSGVLQISGNYGVPGTVGTATVTATQPGDSQNYNAAPAAPYTINIAPRPLSLQILGLPATGVANPGGSATTTSVNNIFQVSGLATDPISKQQIPVQLSYAAVGISGALATGAGIDASNNANIIPFARGKTNIIATPYPNNNYFTGAPVTGVFTTNPLNTVITGLFLQGDFGDTLIPISDTYPANSILRARLVVVDNDGNQLPSGYNNISNINKTYPYANIDQYSPATIIKSGLGGLGLFFFKTGTVGINVKFDGDAFYAAAAPYTKKLTIQLANQYFIQGFGNLQDVVVGSGFKLTPSQLPVPAYPFNPNNPTASVNVYVVSGSPAYIDSNNKINVTGTGLVQLSASYPASGGVSYGVTGTVTGSFYGIQQTQTIPSLGLTGQYVYKNVGFGPVTIKLPTTTSIGLPVSFAISSGSLKSIIPDIKTPSIGTLNPIDSQNIFGLPSQHLDGATFGSEYSGFDTTTIIAYNTGVYPSIAPVYVTGFVNSPIYNGASQPTKTINNILGS